MIIEIHNPKERFTLKRVNDLLPIVMKITDKYAVKVEKSLQTLESLDDKNTEQVSELENQVNLEIRDWHKKVRALGGDPKGLWFVDFNSGEGYFSWKYPDTEIKIWKSYNEGFEITIDGTTEPLLQFEELSKNDENSDCTI